jgi:hypothetical protein
MHRVRVLGVAVGLCASSAALADPIDAFKSGTTLRLRFAKVQADHHRWAASGISLIKAADTLDLDLRATDLGVPLPTTIHLRGDLIGNGIVVYSFTWSGIIPVDRERTLTDATGALFARVSAAPGDRSTGTVAVDVLPSLSTITLTGNWGKTLVTVEQTSLDGGFPPAPLARYARTESAAICSSPRSPVSLPLYVEIDGVAPPWGQWVFLKSSDHPGLALPAIVPIPAGKRSNVFHGTIAPSFAGTVHTIAQASGREVSLDLHVDRCVP